MPKTGAAAAGIGMTMGIERAPADRAILMGMGTPACAPAMITAIITLTHGMVVTTGITIARVTGKLSNAHPLRAAVGVARRS
jgi:hypothetical protein